MNPLEHIDELLAKLEATNIKDAINYEFFNRIALTHHSTSIEGSTLTFEEVQVLIENGIVASGKPLEHNNMVQDHFNALVFVLDEADKKTPLTPHLICKINALVMRSTGGIVNQIGGSYDSSKGEYRKGAVHAGGHYFSDYTKVPALVQKLCDEVNEKIPSLNNSASILSFSFQAHFKLVDIHPFADGNGRTSRLLMNYIQAYHKKPLGMVHSKDKAKYIEALNDCRKKDTMEPIIHFLAKQYMEYLQEQITKSNPGKSNGINFVL